MGNSFSTCACYSATSDTNTTFNTYNINNLSHIHTSKEVDTIDTVESDDLKQEYHENINNNLPCIFEDIIDVKHSKYMNSYEHAIQQPTLFWGIGIENESYLMLSTLYSIDSFNKLKHKRERYSVDYYKSFKPNYLESVFKQIHTLKKLTYPIYINAHTFEKTDIHQQHKTIYDVHSTPNPKFIESIHDILLRDNISYKEMYDKSVVFDGDTIEFITQEFYNTTVEHAIKELCSLKKKWLEEVSPYFKKWNIGDICYPDHNHGFVSFLTTNNNNLGICNTQTTHINITLPTYLQNGGIIDKNKFAKDHLNFIKFIQIVEPLVVACYGTPDIFSLMDQKYSIGSLRASRSRYISLQTFNADVPVNGKLLLMKKTDDPAFWYNLFQDSPYMLSDEIGYDINFNKFKNHGIEIRFLDWFPEIYLKALIDFFILLAQHSLTIGSIKLDKSRYNMIIKNCIQKGFTYLLSSDECHILLQDLRLPLVHKEMTSFELLSYINDILYSRYGQSELIELISPHMNKPDLVNYNFIAFQTLYNDLFSKPDLILRAEENLVEHRTPLIPSNISELDQFFTIYVEKSPSRCYSDEEYSNVGATLVEKNHWINTNHSFIIGLKEIISHTNPTQTLMHFAHCFKKQIGYQNALDLLKPSTFIDYEYILNSDKQRHISFCKQSGKIGCYLALMTYYHQLTHQSTLPDFNQSIYNDLLTHYIDQFPTPKILIIGFGNVGKSCKEVLDLFGLTCTIWTRNHIKDKSILLQHHILIHAINQSNTPQEPFLTIDDLDLPRQLSVISDISCDLGHPYHTLPIYHQYTTKNNPVCILRDENRLELIAINNLPSLEPIVSSTEFSSILINLLPDLRYFKYTKNSNPYAKMLYDSYQHFINAYV